MKIINIMKKKIIIAGVILLVIFGTVTALVMHDIKASRRILQKCPELSKYSVEFYDCFGIIAIEGQPDDNYSKYLVVDYKHNFYVIAGIERLSGYKVVNNILYTIDRSHHNSTSILPDGTIKYTIDVYQNNRPTMLQFDKPEDIPNYISVNISNGEVRRYKNIDEAPKDSQVIFRKLGE